MCQQSYSNTPHLPQTNSLLSPPPIFVTMEPEGLVSEASWSSFDAEMSVEESEVMAQLFGPQSFTSDQDQDPSTGVQQMFWPDHNANSYFCSDNSSCDPYYWPQGNCSTSTTSSGSFLHMPANYEACYLSEPRMVPAVSVCSTPMSFSIGGEQIDTPSFPVGAYHQFNVPVCMNEETSSDEVVDDSLLPPAHDSQAIKRRLHGGDSEVPAKTEEDDSQIGSTKKKARASAPATKKGKNAQPKKSQKSVSTSNEEESNADINPQISCCYSSEDDSNGSQELKGAGATSSSSKGSAAVNPNGKKRAGRGSATDPQSLYARKRRERINERLRILQNLVPNGTKVDISTMLEEAVQYVKFLQLQIKLLSSDELWMYAPIAYNGMNLGLDLKISPSSQQ